MFQSQFAPTCLAVFLVSQIAGGSMVSALAQGFLQVATVRDRGWNVLGLNPDNRPLWLPIFDRDGRTLLHGNNYSARLYAGPEGTPEKDLLPVGQVRRFDLWEGGLPDAEPLTSPGDRIVSIPGVPSGSRATAQLRVWDNQGGTVALWEEAAVRGASKVFTTAPLAGSSEFPQLVPLLEGMESFQLEPKVVSITTVPSGTRRTSLSFYTEIYRSAIRYEARRPGELPRDERHSMEVSNSGSEVLHIFAGAPVLQSFRSSRLGSGIRVDPPAGFHAVSAAGVSSDGQTVLLNAFQGSVPKVLLRGSEIPLDHAYVLSGSGDYAVGRAGGSLVRWHIPSGTTERIRPLRSGDTDSNPVLDVSEDGQVVLLEAGPGSGSAPWLWTPVQGLVGEGLPEGFEPRGLSGNGNVVVGAWNGRPAYGIRKASGLELHAVGPAEARGRLEESNWDGSVMVGRATTDSGPHVLFLADGSSHSFQELLPDVEAPQFASGLPELSDVRLRWVAGDPSGEVVVVGTAATREPVPQEIGFRAIVSVAARRLGADSGVIRLSIDGDPVVFDRDGKTPLWGAAFSAQLYAGKMGASVEDLQPVGLPERCEPRKVSDRWTYPWIPQLALSPVPRDLVPIPMVPSGSVAVLELRVWNNEGDTVNRWESARIRGRSGPFTSQPLGSWTDIWTNSIQIPSLEGVPRFQLLPARTAPVTSGVATFRLDPRVHASPVASRDGSLMAVRSGGSNGAVEILHRSRGEPTPARVAQLAGTGGGVEGLQVVAVVTNRLSVLVNNSSAGGTNVLLWRDGVASVLPLLKGWALSEDGNHVVGVQRQVSDRVADAGSLVRLDVRSGTVERIRDWTPVQTERPENFSASLGLETLLCDNTVWNNRAGVLFDLRNRPPSNFSIWGLTPSGEHLLGGVSKVVESTRASGTLQHALFPALLPLDPTLALSISDFASATTEVYSPSGRSRFGPYLITQDLRWLAAGFLRGPRGLVQVLGNDGTALRLDEILDLGSDIRITRIRQLAIDGGSALVEATDGASWWLDLPSPIRAPDPLVTGSLDQL